MIALALVALIVLAVVLAACLLVRSPLRLLFPVESGFVARAGALALTLLFWGGTVAAMFTSLFSLFQWLALLFFSQSLANVAPVYRQSGLWHALNQLLPEETRLLNILHGFPLISVLLMLATLALLVRLFSNAQQVTDAPWVKWLRTVPERMWSDTLILAIFFFGVYLSIASFCAVPVLQVNETLSDSEKAQIKGEIEGFKPSDTVFAKEFPEKLGLADPLASLQSALGIAKTEKAAPEKPHAVSSPGPGVAVKAAKSAEDAVQREAEPARIPVPSPAPSSLGALATAPLATAQVVQGLQQDSANKDYAERFVAFGEGQRNENLSAYGQLRDRVAQAIQDDLLSTENQVDSNFAVRLTGRDRSTYLAGLASSYQQDVSLQEDNLRDCTSFVQTFDNELAVRGQLLERELVQAATGEGSGSLQDTAAPASQSSTGDVFRGNPCLPDSRSTTQPRQVAPQPNLGLFNFFAGWLVASDSLPLAVLSGMLGVSLLGSIVSTFVRQRTKAVQSGGPMVPDVFQLLVRGFSAAIVVYLSIQGGLNVVSAGTNQANPYVLLLTCLVGAVFSEDVWNAAHLWLNNTDKNGNEKGKAGAHGTPVVPPVAKKPEEGAA